MDKMKNIESIERYRVQIKELFKEFASSDLYDAWIDTFEIESVDNKRVIVHYYGDKNIKLFQKECKSALLSAIYSVAGSGKKVKFLKQSAPSNALSPKVKNNLKAINFFALAMVFMLIAISVFVVLFSYIENRNFKETFYSANSIKVDSNVRIIQISDLHCASYGKNNKDLLKRVEALKPDLIICTGDIVNSAKTDSNYAIDLAKKLSEIAPSYYIYGNNEAESVFDVPLNQTELDKKFGFDDSNRDETALLEIEDTFEEKLEKAGIKVLKNEMDTIKVKTMMIDVYGVLTSNPSSFWSYSAKSFSDYIHNNPDHIKITAVHEPYIFEEFQPEYWGDLMVCGHTHGGVAHVPVLGPLYTEEGGLLPEGNGKFVYGRYDAAGSPLIVSSGLTNSTLLRINNQPELVVVDVNKF